MTALAARLNTVALDAPPHGGRWGDGCLHVFLDVGANIGVQTRKLFEPHAYEQRSTSRDGAYTVSTHGFSWLDAFNRSFGVTHRHRVCAFAFEANERHTPRLRNLQACYARRGMRAAFFTETAAADVDGNLTFFRDPVGAAKQEWAASVMRHGKRGSSMPARAVAAVDLAAWIQRHIVQRQIPSSTSVAGRHGGTTAIPQILMKLDIEGAEFRVLPKMLDMGLLCNADSSRRISKLALEWHFWDRESGMKVLGCQHHDTKRCMKDLRDRLVAQQAAERSDCTQLVEADDDSFMNDSPLALDPQTCTHSAPAPDNGTDRFDNGLGGHTYRPEE